MKKVQKSLFVLCLIAMPFILAILYDSIGRVTYSKGTRTGVVIKISQPGIIWSTIEGELQCGGTMPTMWEFSVESKEMKEKLEIAEKSQKRCTLTYRQQLWKQSWRGRTTYFITDVQYYE